MARLIKPKINRIFQTKIEQLTLDLAQRSTCIAVIENSVDCPNCKLDPVNKSSTGKYNGTGPKPFTGQTCPVCRNKGKVVTEERHTIEANIRWGKGDKAHIPLAQGWLPEGMVRGKALVRWYETVKKATYFLIDGIRCSPEGDPKKRGLLNHVIVEFYGKIDK